MKITVEIKLPKELEQLLQNLSQATLVYTEGATSFQPQDCQKACANVQIAEPAEEPAPAINRSAAVSEPKKTEPAVTLAVAKQAILSMENGHALAMDRLKAKGMKKLADLSPEQLVDFLAELGVET